MRIIINILKNIINNISLYNHSLIMNIITHQSNSINTFIYPLFTLYMRNYLSVISISYV